MNTENLGFLQKIKELEAENAALKKEQVKISEAKELYLKIFEEFPALIWRSRLDKLCDYFNKTWLEFTGRTFEQEFGNGWAESVHPDDFDFCLNTYVTAFDKREAFLMEYRMMNKFGEYRWIRDFGQPFFDLDNSFLGYIGSCYDITEIKDNEFRLMELNATKDKFFSIIAHDLRSPFNTIVGFSESLMESIEEKDYVQVEEMAKIINQSSNRAMALLTNLMTWSRLESGRMPFHKAPLDIQALVSESVALIQPSAGQKSIQITNTIASTPLVDADREMIATVMRNLLSNAIKFTHKGGEVKVSSAVEANELVVTVADNGVGIPRERIETLFHMSESTSTPGTQHETGTGLGLMLCKEFIDHHHGSIRVESTEGKGTSISFTLPMAALR